MCLPRHERVNDAIEPTRARFFRFSILLEEDETRCQILRMQREAGKSKSSHPEARKLGLMQHRSWMLTNSDR
jgi:hypothetical protein